MLSLLRYALPRSNLVQLAGRRGLYGAKPLHISCRMVLLEQRAASQGHKFTAEVIHVAWRREPELNLWEQEGSGGPVIVPWRWLSLCRLLQKGQRWHGGDTGIPRTHGDKVHTRERLTRACTQFMERQGESWAVHDNWILNSVRTRSYWAAKSFKETKAIEV